jgi:probable O-glycosylation ligase (exosortase A-associated)
MRDLILTAVILGVVPVALFRPWIGVLSWVWISYMTPHRLTWGFAHSMPFVKIVAIATLVGLLVSGEAKTPPRTVSVAILLAFWAWITLTSLSANQPDLAWPEWMQSSETLISTFVVMFLFQDVRKVKYLVLVTSLSLAYYGVKSGLAGLLTGFSARAVAFPERTFINDNNHLALALNVVLPFLVFLAQEEKRRALKVGLYAVAGMTVLGIISTFSRGGFLGLCVTTLLLVLRSQRKVMGLAAIVLIAMLGTPLLLSTGWYGRITSIGEYEEDKSVQGRFVAWEVATKLALDSPLTGGGFRALQPEIYRRYGYYDVKKEFVAHSIVFQVLGDHGFVGLGLFVILIGTTLLSLELVVRVATGASELSEVRHLAWITQTSLISYVVCGLFLALAYFPIVYHLSAIGAILVKLAHGQVSANRNTIEQDWAMLNRPLPGQVS